MECSSEGWTGSLCDATPFRPELAAPATPERREAMGRQLLPMAEKAVVSPEAPAARAESVHLTVERVAMAEEVFSRKMGQREAESAVVSAIKSVRAE